MAEVSWRFDIDRPALEAEVAPTLFRAANSITRRISAAAKIRVPVKTGNLGRSIEPDPIRFVAPMRVETGVTANARYAAAVHDGARPHTILPKNGPFLVFPGRGGRTVFARIVHHPGNRARPFLANAAREVAESLR